MTELAPETGNRLQVRGRRSFSRTQAASFAYSKASAKSTRLQASPPRFRIVDMDLAWRYEDLSIVASLRK